jgi:hypothetical protein
MATTKVITTARDRELGKLRMSETMPGYAPRVTQTHQEDRRRDARGNELTDPLHPPFGLPRMTMIRGFENLRFLVASFNKDSRFNLGQVE